MAVFTLMPTFVLLIIIIAHSQYLRFNSFPLLILFSMNEQHVWLDCADGVRKKRPENEQFVKIHSHYKNGNSSPTKLILAKKSQN